MKPHDSEIFEMLHAARSSHAISRASESRLKTLLHQDMVAGTTIEDLRDIAFAEDSPLSARVGFGPGSLDALRDALVFHRERSHHRPVPEPVTRKAKTMNFGQALEHLKAGSRVMRSGWNGRGMWLVLILADEVEVAYGHELAGLRLHPFIAMCPVGGGLVPWLASQTDILAEDWEVVA